MISNSLLFKITVVLDGKLVLDRYLSNIKMIFEGKDLLMQPLIFLEYDSKEMDDTDSIPNLQRRW